MRIICFDDANFIDKNILRKPLQQHKQHLSRFDRPKERIKITLESHYGNIFLWHVFYIRCKGEQLANLHFT